VAFPTKAISTNIVTSLSNTKNEPCHIEHLIYHYMIDFATINYKCHYTTSQYKQYEN
jgi:hypothetical protein